MAGTFLALATLVAAAPLAAGAGGSPAPAAASVAPAAPARSPALAYIPDDADLSVFVRFEGLKTTNLWKTFADPALGLYARLAHSLPPAIGLERDVVAAGLAGSLADLPGEGQLGVVLETGRDIDAKTLLQEERPAVSLPGIATPVYSIGGEEVMAVPEPRIVVIASSRDYLSGMLEAGRRAKTAPSGPPPSKTPAVSGEITFAVRMPPALKDAVLEEYRQFRERALRPNMDGEALMAFALHYNLVRIALQVETVTGSLDLARDADALRVEVRFASAQMAPLMADVLQALADPLQMGLPALLGGRPLEEPPSYPLYRAVADEGTVRLTMSRDGAYRLVANLVDSAKAVASTEGTRKTSARNLRTLGAAVLAYFAVEGTWPRTWSDLMKADLIQDPAVFRNPALTAHPPTGDYELVPLTPEAIERDWLMAVLAYEVYPVGQEPSHLNVLFADGHVEYVEFSKFRRLYRQTLESLGR